MCDNLKFIGSFCELDPQSESRQRDSQTSPREIAQLNGMISATASFALGYNLGTFVQLVRLQKILDSKITLKV